MNSHDLLTRRSTLLFFTEFFQLSGGKKGGTVAHPAPFLRRGSSLGCPWCCATSVCPWLCWSLNSVPAAAFQVGIMLCFFSANWDVAMGQYLLIPFLGGWTSIYQLFWCSPGVQGFDTLPYKHYKHENIWNMTHQDSFLVKAFLHSMRIQDGRWKIWIWRWFCYRIWPNSRVPSEISAV